MDNMYRITDIFYTINGEGRNVGLPVVFIRFFGCNLNCPFCDEYLIWSRWKENEADFSILTAKQIVEKIRNLLNKYPESIQSGIPINFTGGEPLLQLDGELLGELRVFGDLYLETNGTLDTGLAVYNLDYITVSPKFKVIENEMEWTRIASDIKLMIFPNRGLDVIIERLNLICNSISDNREGKIIYLQPANNELRVYKFILGEVFDAIRTSPFLSSFDIRVGYQLHKFIGVS